MCGNVEDVDGVSVHWYIIIPITITFDIKHNTMIVLVFQQMPIGDVNG